MLCSSYATAISVRERRAAYLTSSSTSCKRTLSARMALASPLSAKKGKASATDEFTRTSPFPRRSINSLGPGAAPFTTSLDKVFTTKRLTVDCSSSRYMRTAEIARTSPRSAIWAKRSNDAHLTSMSVCPRHPHKAMTERSSPLLTTRVTTCMAASLTRTSWSLRQSHSAATQRSSPLAATHAKMRMAASFTSKSLSFSRAITASTAPAPPFKPRSASVFKACKRRQAFSLSSKSSTTASKVTIISMSNSATSGRQ
mmetsp:Transcript_8772/g.16025  ORF Transcript_8772/g.16025 Transcript_8772/m.16025 type:complete len:256 (-) Transcript_8772:400-1167(-)